MELFFLLSFPGIECNPELFEKFPGIVWEQADIFAFTLYNMGVDFEGKSE